MPGPAHPGRSARVVRTLSVLAAFTVVVTLVAAGTPGGASDDPASVPEAAAAAEPSPAAASDGPGTDPLTARASSGPPPASAASPPPAPPPRKAVDALAAAGLRARRITDRTKDWASFTLIDRSTRRTVGDSRSAQVTLTESTVKAWLAADLLATRARQGRALTAYETARMAAMIRRSDDNAAEVIWRWLGADGAIRDMIRTCGLTDTTVYPDWWSKTRISSRDLARVGDCIVPGKGKFLSPTVGAPLFQLMRSVELTNAFGIQQAQPAGKGVPVAVKNGWTEHGATGQWNVNCLGIWGPRNRWVLSITLRYPSGDGLAYGADVCRRVTAALFPLVKTG